MYIFTSERGSSKLAFSGLGKPLLFFLITGSPNLEIETTLEWSFLEATVWLCLKRRIGFNVLMSVNVLSAFFPLVRIRI